MMGLLFAAANLIRIPLAPAAGLIADAHNDRRFMMLALSALSLAAFILFALAKDPTAIGLWMMAATVLWSSGSPILEGATLRLTDRFGLPYGRVRVWGSAAFMAGSVVAGLVSARYGFGIVAPWMVVCCALQLGAVARLPPPRVRETTRFAVRLQATLAEARELASKPVFMLFLVVGSLIQSSHIVYYSYGGLHWREQGISASVIGIIWPLGVIAEIVLFTFSAAVVRRIGPVTLLFLGALACTLRWTLMAFDPPLPALVAIQLLHGFTFSVPHLGAMYFILNATPPRLAATAQSLYGVVAIGLASSLALLPASALYAAWGGRTYLLMSAMSATAMLLSLALARAWTGKRLTEAAAVEDHGGI
jgi:PPP family 3-phenylpropionic acid transporter